MSYRTALITGISGQDGSLLAHLLLDKGYRVVGTARDCQISSFDKLKRLGIFDKVERISMAPTDFRSILQTITKVNPDEIYNLAGQSSVGLSFQQPVETLESICLGTLNLLEAIRFVDSSIRFYNAGSGECFGDTQGVPADENTPFRPRSPYGVAKATSCWEVTNYREAYGIYACSGILFNHESPLRPERFVTRKIISAACRIAAGSREKLNLGNISISRDWGWAAEYVEAMWKMLQMDVPDDYVIATGEANSLESFIDEAFKCVGLDWRDHVVTDPTLIRPTEIMTGVGNPGKANSKLGWRAKLKMKEIIKLMVAHENTKMEDA